MADFADLMKKAQEMQADMQNQMAEAQNGLSDLRAAGAAGAGLVKVTVDGKGMMVSLNLDPSLFTEEDKEVVEDLVVAAYKDAREKAEQLAADHMQKIGGNMQDAFGSDFGKSLADMMPDGFKFPF